MLDAKFERECRIMCAAFHEVGVDARLMFDDDGAVVGVECPSLPCEGGNKAVWRKARELAHLAVYGTPIQWEDE